MEALTDAASVGKRECIASTYTTELFQAYQQHDGNEMDCSICLADS